MAITDYKITDNEINTYNVKSAPDTLKANAQSNKNWFDRLGEFFISKYNSLLDFIQGDFINVDEVGAGLTYENNLEWKHALHKNVIIANYSGNITQITTGYRTIIANVTGLTTDDFMDCIMNINGTDYQCADAYESGDYATTTCNVEGVEVTITYSLSGGDITLTHTQNPLDTLYWNIQMFSTVAEKVPRKALPATVSNDGYTELNDKCTELKNLLEKATRIVVLTGERVLTAKTPITINQALPSNIDINNVHVLSVSQNRTTNGTSYYNIGSIEGTETASGYFPRAAIIEQNENYKEFQISIYNPTSTEQTIKWRLVYQVIE